MKRVYFNYMVSLMSYKNNEIILEDYAKEFVTLLKYTINIHNNIVLQHLSENLESILVAYIFDLAGLLENTVKITNSKEKSYLMLRYKNLIIANNAVKELIKNYNDFGDCNLKEIEHVKEILLQL